MNRKRVATVLALGVIAWGMSQGAVACPAQSSGAGTTTTKATPHPSATVPTVTPPSVAGEGTNAPADSTGFCEDGKLLGPEITTAHKAKLKCEGHQGVAVWNAPVKADAQLAALTTTGTWGSRAAEALAAWHAVDAKTPSKSVLGISYAGIAEATLNGWDAPEVTTLLNRVMALRNPDGGWGLNYAWDAFSDGSVNPATTSYTVTMADHVGPFLLGAYQHGLIGVEPLTTIGKIIVGIPRWSLYGGACVPYSTTAADRAKPTYCVHNVNAAVDLFLTQLWNAGIGISGATSVRALVTKAEVAAYSFKFGSWPYSQANTAVAEDHDHESLNVEAMLTEAPSLGYFPQVAIMINSFPTDANSRLAHFRLASTRCVSANQWFGEFDGWLATPPASPDIRLAQMARWASRTAAVCEAP